MKEDIAIIGMSCRFPGANNVDEFWNNLISGKESISFFSREELEESGISAELLDMPNYVRAKGCLDKAELFDASFFGISPRDAQTMDPQHKVFLECCWEALENAGYWSENEAGRVSIIAGTSGFNIDSYFQHHLSTNESIKQSIGDYQLNLNNGSDFVSTRASYKFNFTGPSYTLQAGCSTSLIAVSQACQSLLNYQCDTAVVGAVAISLPIRTGYLYHPGMILSPDGHCRAFDKDAQGTVLGNGIGVVVLKRLTEAQASGDHIYAVIKGFAINNDGAEKIGYTAPSELGQAAVIAEALGMAECEPESIGYIETHGTATKQGDPIEISGLKSVFSDNYEGKTQCILGSVKTNIGHLDAAAGMAGLIKTVLCLYHKTIPPTLHFQTINPEIDLSDTPFHINNSLMHWDAPATHARRAAVSSFGIGGTNTHIVLEEILQSPVENKTPDPDWVIIPLSAKTESALKLQQNHLLEYLIRHPTSSLADIAYTYQVGRKPFEYKSALITKEIEDAIVSLRDHNEQRLLMHSPTCVDTSDESLKKAFHLAEQWFSDDAPLWQAGKTHFRNRIPLPTYPFERIKHWVDIGQKNNSADIKQVEPETKPLTSVSKTLPEIQDVIIKTWEKYLHLEDIQPNDNFFELGGDSIAGIQISLCLQQLWQIECPTNTLFNHSRAVDLAAYIYSLIITSNKTVSTPISVPSESAPLSFSQQRMWFLEQYEAGIYNVPIAIQLDGPLNIRALEYSFNCVLEQHQALRIYFKLDDQATPIQSIHSFSPIELQVEPIDEAEISYALHRASHHIFNLLTGPLFRINLFRLHSEKHILMINQHHVVCDGWSLRILLQDMSIFYHAYLVGKTLPLATATYQYLDFCRDQKLWTQDQKFHRNIAFWQQKLADIQPLDLLTDYPRPYIEKHAGKSIYIQLGSELTAHLKTLSREKNTTLFVMLLSALNILLYKYTNQTDIVLGTPVANRNQSAIKDLFGLFVNTLVIRNDLSNNPRYLDLLEKIHQTCIEAFEHQDIPFEKIIDNLNIERDTSRNSLFQVLMIFQNYCDRLEPTFTHIQSKLIPNHYDVAQMDLTFHIIEAESGLNCRIEYNTSLFNSTTIEKMATHFKSVLQSIVKNPHESISHFSILNPTERQSMLVDWNATSNDNLPKTTLHALFEQQVARTPNAIAILYENQTLTYQELNNKADQLAYTLLNKFTESDQFFNHQPLIGLCIERNTDMIVGILGILKSGAAYVPLDLSHPDQRLRSILDEAKIELIVTKLDIIKKRPYLFPHTKNNIFMDELRSDLPEPTNRVTVVPDTLAYTLFTSGSTGKPKGVAVEHQNVVNLLTDIIIKLGVSSTDSLLSVSSYAFDISILEFFLPLISGAQLHLLSTEQTKIPSKLVACIESHKKCIVQATPTTWEMIVDSLSNIQTELTVLTGGEALNKLLAGKLLKYAHKVWNVYGPTETTIWSTFHELHDQDDYAIIGRGFANTQVYVLDEFLNVLPAGIPGELYIGGKGLARGYLNQPELTKNFFIQNPFNNDRIYKTGDMVRWRHDGRLEYIGRCDSQIKIRGYRIDLQEVEIVLDLCVGIKSSVCAVQNINNMPQLVAYYCLSIDSDILQMSDLLFIEQLRNELALKLPDYMIPAYFMRLQTFPINVSGKIDRRRLPIPDLAYLSNGTTNVLPKNHYEQLIFDIWRSILKIEDIDIDRSFFLLGGNSLLIVQVHAQLIKQGYQTNITDHFQYPTIRMLARKLATLDQAPLTASEPRTNRRTFSSYKQRTKAKSALLTEG